MSNTYTLSRLLADEYEIQHYGFSSTSFIAEFKEFLIHTIKSSHNDMESCVTKKLSLSDENKEILHKEMEIITGKYINVIEECLKQKDAIIRNYFAIPQNVILEEDKIHHDLSNVSEENLILEINKLQEQYIKEKSMCILLKKELKEFDKISKLLIQLSTALQHTNKIPDITEENMGLNKLNEVLMDIVEKIENECNIEFKLKRHQNKFVKSNNKTCME